MGFFDVVINKELKAVKEELVSKLEKKLAPLSDETIKEKNSLLFKNFKAEGTLLNYDLSIEIEKSKESLSLNIFGELLNVWIMVIIIVAGILFTYGLGVILLVAFVYYQKVVVTKYINKTLDSLATKTSE